MTVFHLHPAVAVFDEAAESAVFDDYRIRDEVALRTSLRSQAFPVAVYKVISDSHLISDLLAAFPDARVLWMYRSPQENAASQLKKFAEPVRAIRLVHAGEPGGGWLAEGASDESLDILRRIDASGLSDQDWACLNWWLRNRSYLEQGLDHDDRVRLLRYETLAADPVEVLGRVTDWLDLPRDEGAVRFVHTRSVRKSELPPLQRDVARLCESLLEVLDEKQAFIRPVASGPRLESP
jgi:hypothetical protein